MSTFQQGDLVKFRQPQNAYESNAIFIVLEPRGPRMAVKDTSLMNAEYNGTLLQSAWTVYATEELELCAS